MMFSAHELPSLSRGPTGLTVRPYSPLSGFGSHRLLSAPCFGWVVEDSLDPRQVAERETGFQECPGHGAKRNSFQLLRCPRGTPGSTSARCWISGCQTRCPREAGISADLVSAILGLNSRLHFSQDAGKGYVSQLFLLPNEPPAGPGPHDSVTRII